MPWKKTLDPSADSEHRAAATATAAAPAAGAAATAAAATADPDDRAGVGVDVVEAIARERVALRRLREIRRRSRRVFWPARSLKKIIFMSGENRSPVMRVLLSKSTLLAGVVEGRQPLIEAILAFAAARAAAPALVGLRHRRRRAATGRARTRPAGAARPEPAGGGSCSRYVSPWPSVRQAISRLPCCVRAAAAAARRRRIGWRLRVVLHAEVDRPLGQLREHLAVAVPDLLDLAEAARPARRTRTA